MAFDTPIPVARHRDPDGGDWIPTDQLLIGARLERGATRGVASGVVVTFESHGRTGTSRFGTTLWLCSAGLVGRCGP